MSEDTGKHEPKGRSTPLASSRFADATNRFVHATELVAAAVFALLFAIGVVDLLLQILQAVRSGTITDPLVVIGFIDTGLLLLIIVEVYETVIAYTEETDTRRIVRLVIYTGVIAMVRKAIIYRVSEYSSAEAALYAAIGYTILIFGLVALLMVERRYTGSGVAD
ncbi:phosphate-starvation-inducible PsiE family protein [Haloplanus sp. C73]|uniref:phosphate-starvation-inducible PsiE family protein n=1 Tax=Haloplanus sp. C73 TaxID=3421641 RepID=UPI003EBD2021